VLTAKQVAIPANLPLFAAKGLPTITPARFCGCFSYGGFFVDPWRYIPLMLIELNRCKNQRLANELEGSSERAPGQLRTSRHSSFANA